MTNGGSFVVDDGGPRGVAQTLAVEERTLSRILATQAERLGDRPMVGFGQEPPVGFDRIDADTNRIARGLRRLGLGHGDRLALILPNCREFVELWFGASKVGAIEVPINPELRGPLLAHPLNDASPTVIACHVDQIDALAAQGDAIRGASVIVTGNGSATRLEELPTAARVLAWEELDDEDDARPIDCPATAADPVAILYTSGTTGPAKGVVMPYLQYWAFVEGLVANLGLDGDDIYYTPLPLFHADAQIFGTYFPMMYGATGVIDPRFSASRFWERIEETGATATNLLGAMAHILWKAEPGGRDADNSLRTCQAIPMVQFRCEFEERFGLRLATGYGQTETNFVTRDTADDWRPDSCGRAAPGFEVRIVDRLDRPLPAGESGEIVVRAGEPFSMCLGYFNDAAKTVRTARNLWWHTGDAGHLDADGWLYFDGRIKDAIRRRGENVSAYEVEAIVDAHPSVLESAAIAVPSEMSEDEIMVVAAPRTGCELSPTDLLQYCIERMPRHMVPRYVRLHDGPLPRTPTEKIAKEDLRGDGVTTQTWDRESDAYSGGSGR